MLVTMKDMAARAQKGKGAVGAFLALNLEQAQGVLEAAVEERAPVVVALDEPGAMYAGLGAFQAMVKELAEDVPVPVSLVLDHVRDPVLVAKAFAAGFDGVTVDPRDAPWEEAAGLLSSLKDLCAEHSAFFEASIAMEGRSLEQALTLAQKIGKLATPDSLCVSLSGESKKGPDPEFFGFLRRAGAAGAGVSLAGAGAWPDEDLKGAVTAGAWKVSVGTRTNLAFTRGLRSFMERNPDRVHPSSYLAAARESLSAEVRRCIRTLRS